MRSAEKILILHLREARRNFDFAFARNADNILIWFSGLTISCKGGVGDTWDPRAELAGREGHAEEEDEEEEEEDEKAGQEKI